MFTLNIDEIDELYEYNIIDYDQILFLKIFNPKTAFEQC